MESARPGGLFARTTLFARAIDLLSASRQSPMPPCRMSGTAVGSTASYFLVSDGVRRTVPDGMCGSGPPIQVALKGTSGMQTAYEVLSAEA